MKIFYNYAVKQLSLDHLVSFKEFNLIDALVLQIYCQNQPILKREQHRMAQDCHLTVILHPDNDY